MAIYDYIGIPYKNKGRDLAGCDCFGLVKMFYKQELFIYLPEYDYSDAEDAEDASRTLINGRGEWKEVTKPAFGDVIMLNVAGLPVHIGVVLEHRRMLHSLKGHNSAIELYDGFRWKNRIEGFYRYG